MQVSPLKSLEFILIPVAGLAVGLLVLFAFWGQRASRPIELGSETCYEQRAPAELVGVEKGRLLRRSELEPTLPRQGERSTGESTDEKDKKKVRPERERVVTDFHVLYEDGTAAPGLELFAMTPGDTDDWGLVHGETDQEGIFRAHLDPDGSSISVRVTDKQTQSVILEWAGPRLAEVTLTVPRPRFLRMRLTSPDGGTSLHGHRYSVRLDSFEGLDTPVRFLGVAEFAEDGTCTMPAYFGQRERTLQASIGVDGHLVLEDRQPTENFLSPAGATFELDFVTVQVVVTDGDGVALGAAQVHMQSRVTGTVSRVTVDEEGIGELVLPRGPAILCASAPGFQAHLTTIDPVDGERVEVRMRAVEPGSFTVRVESPLGCPVEDALITVAPGGADRECTYVAAIQRRSNAEGAAEFPLTILGPATIVAYHPDYGFTESYPFHCSRGEEVVLRMEDVCTLEVVAKADGIVLPEHEVLRWAVLDRIHAREWEGRLGPGRREIDFLPVGDLVVELFSPSAGLVGVEPVFISEPGRYRLDAELARGVFAEGTISPVPEGRCVVTALSPNVPEDLSRRWCRTLVQPDGSFSIFSPALERVNLSVQTENGQRSSHSVDPLDVISLHLDDD